MVRNRSRTFRSSRGTRAKTTWDQVFASFTQTPAAVSSFIDISSSQIQLSNEATGTCKRMIGMVTVEHAAAAAAVEETNFGIGIAVITNDARLAGATPDPLSVVDANQDWYYWSHHRHSLGLAGSEGGLIKVPIDIRSMRRLRGGYRLVLIFEKATTELGLFVTVSFRNLWTMP